MKKPSWKTGIVPHFIGPCLPVKGDFLKHAWPAPLALWSFHALQLAARHALSTAFQAACADELERRRP